MKNTNDSRRDAGRRAVLAAMFLALALVLPFLTGQVPQIGSALLPMHLPVLLCGFLYGWPYGLAVGALAPVLRSALFGMPPMMPQAAAMAFELAAYGVLAAVLYRLLPRRAGWIYVSLLGAMLGGRIVWGAAAAVFYRLAGLPFGWEVFAAGAFVNAIPGIVLQLVLLPAMLLALRRTKLLPHE